jgi:hypothetical protein
LGALPRLLFTMQVPPTRPQGTHLTAGHTWTATHLGAVAPVGSRSLGSCTQACMHSYRITETDRSHLSYFTCSVGTWRPLIGYSFHLWMHACMLSHVTVSPIKTQGVCARGSCCACALQAVASQLACIGRQAFLSRHHIGPGRCCRSHNTMYDCHG